MILRSKLLSFFFEPSYCSHLFLLFILFGGRLIYNKRIRGNCVFPQYFYNRKLGEVTVFFAVFCWSLIIAVFTEIIMQYADHSKIFKWVSNKLDGKEVFIL